VPDRAGPLSISIDRDVCIGSGMCIMYAPGTFAQDEQTKAVVTDPDGDPVESIRVAVEACPTGALRIIADREGV
jgi:ferredoxin